MWIEPSELFRESFRLSLGCSFSVRLLQGSGKSFGQEVEKRRGKKLHSPVRHLGPKHHIQLKLKFFIKGTVILYFWSFTAKPALHHSHKHTEAAGDF